MQSDRSKSTSPFNPDDTWDNEVEAVDYSKERYNSITNSYNQMKPASEDQILKAFSQSSAMRQIMMDSGNVHYSKSRDLLRTQNRQKLEEPINNSILPYSVRNEGFVDDYYVGSLNVEDQVVTGSMTDRLGNVYEVWESQMPPADHDYKSTSATSNDRHLQRLQGYDIYNEKKKTEVKGVVNPAEPMPSVQDAKLRQNEMEFNGREAFFNQNGLQPVQEFDDNRDMYDGYNWKAGHETRTFPLEHSWRNQLCTSEARRKASLLPEQNTVQGLPSRRKEKCKIFAVKNANATVISAKSARLTLPVVSEAGMRSDTCGIFGKARHIAEGNSDGAKLSNVDSIAIQQGRLEVAHEPQKSDQMFDGPVPMASIEQINAQREQDAINPKATREWHMIQKIAEGIDHMGQDDTELCEIMQSADINHEASSMPESFDHIANKELASKEASALTSQVYEASTSTLSAKPQIKSEKAYINRKPMSSTIVEAQKQSANVQLPKTDRATHVIHRPAYSQTFVSSHTLENKVLPQTKRNNHAKEEERYDGLTAPRIHAEQLSKKQEENDLYSREENPHSQNSYRLMKNVVETEREEDDTYYREQHGESNVLSRQMESHIVPTTSVEHQTYQRTNAMHSSIPLESMRNQPVDSLGSAGTTETDRLQSVHPQNWRKQESLVIAETKQRKDRCTPVRVPSRNISTPIRMTPQLQVESKRESAKCNERMTPTIHNQVPRSIPALSRDE
tara:strand:- start:581 stop:2776 length:2196 start_codon:yes stop_codon:yes gene_type:complete